MIQLKYWVKISKDGTVSDIITRKTKPAGPFIDITDCLSNCCTFNPPAPEDVQLRTNYWVRISSDGKPLSSNILRRKDIPSGGIYANLNACISACCGFRDALDAPTNLLIDQNSIIRWDAVPNATGYSLDRATNNTFTTGLTTVTTVTNQSPQGVLSAGTYYFRVKATRAGMTDSAYSNIYSIEVH